MNLNEVKKMDVDKTKIINECRRNLIPYALQAYSAIPEQESPRILDAGCGTGVLSLFLGNICNGTIYALDTDSTNIAWLKEEVSTLNLSQKLEITQGSIFDNSLFQFEFDIIFAEGLLNVVGFNKGLPALADKLKRNGYLILHDEDKDDLEKRKSFKKNRLKLLDCFQLDEKIWWQEYYCRLEKGIENYHNNSLFKKEIQEIQNIKVDPHKFRSIYYILRKEK